MSHCSVKRRPLVLTDKDVELGMVPACRDEMAKGHIGMNVKHVGNCDH